jgi:hypothetical protein
VVVPYEASRFAAAAGKHLGGGLDEAEDPRGYFSSKSLGKPLRDGGLRDLFPMYKE